MRRNKKRFLLCILGAILILASAVFLLVWGSNTFTYSNLYDNDSQTVFRTLFLERGVPEQNIRNVLSQTDTFYSTPFRGLVTEGWKKASIPFFSYRNEDGFAHLDTQPDNLINCRMTAFQIIKDSISFGETTLSVKEEKDVRSRKLLTDPDDLLHYDLLFADLENPGIASSDELVQLFTDYWKDARIQFKGSICLIMANGASSGILQNFHTAIAVYEEDCIWLFEKYDPIHPYQLSRFDCEEDMIRYMKKRVQGIEYAAVFANDTCLWKRG